MRPVGSGEGFPTICQGKKEESKYSEDLPSPGYLLWARVKELLTVPARCLPYASLRTMDIIKVKVKAEFISPSEA